jgi:chaperone modulatory protein CbpM
MLQIDIKHQDNLLDSYELCRCSEITELILFELVEHNIAIPLRGDEIHTWLFSVATLIQVKKATRIQRDLALDWPALSIILQLIEERDVLVQQNRLLEEQLDKFIQR